MTQLASIDFPNQRIYLHSDTVTQNFDGYLLYDDIRTFVQGNVAAQGFDLPISKEGYVAKGGGAFTPRFIILDSGWRLVPYDGVSHTLEILVETISVDGVSDRDVFDRSTVLVEVDIDTAYSQVEIIEVNTGGGGGGSGLTAQETRDAMMLSPSVGVPGSNSIDAELDALLSDVTTILLAINNVTDGLPAIKAAIDTKPTNAEVNAEMVDVLEIDTHSEPAAVLGSTSSIKDVIMWLKIMSKNRMLQSATTTTLRNTGDTVNVSTSTVSDNGTVFSRGEHQ